MIKNYVEFTAFGAYCGEFVDYLISSKYEVFDISSANDIFTVKTAPRNYPQIARKAREFRTKTKIVKRSGFYFTLRRYRRRIGIPLGALAFFGIIVLMSNFVWSIKISGNEQITNWQILEQLSKSGISAGVNTHSFDANRAELELSLALPQLAWVSIERSGSRVNIKVSEREEDASDSRVIPLNVPCDIIAGRSGQLVEAEVYRGELLCEIGDGVSAGEMVVSGAVTDFAGGYNYVHADAKLLFEAEEFADFYQPYTTLNSADSGRFLSNKSIIFLGKRFGGEVKISRHADHVVYSEDTTLPRVFGFPTPFRVLEQRYTFRERVEVTDSPADSRVKLDEQIELYETNFLKDAEIMDKDVEYYPDENGIGAIVRYVFRVDVALKVEITRERQPPVTPETEQTAE